MESICVAVKFTVDEESASYGWSYAGGCFEDGRIANYMPAIPGQDYTFDKLDFEVREYSEDMAESIGSMFSLSGFFGLLASLAILGAIVVSAIVVYKHVKANREEGTNNVEMTNQPGTGANGHAAFLDED